MSRPFIPARNVGGSVFVEADPIWMDATVRTRGIEYPSDDRSAPRRVIVHEPNLARMGEQYLDVFQELVWAHGILRCDLVPEVRGTYGKDGRVHAMVVEELEGITLERLFMVLHERGEQVPPAIALAITHALVPLWQLAGCNHFWLGSTTVVLSPSGRVRVRPRWNVEYSRGDATNIPVEEDIGDHSFVASVSYPYLSSEPLYRPSPEVYVLGSLLCEMLTGRPALDDLGHTIPEVLHNYEGQEVITFAGIRDALPEPTVEFVLRALALRACDRFDSWAQFDEGLTELRQRFEPAGPEHIAAMLASVASPLEIEPRRCLITRSRNEVTPSPGYTPLPWPERSVLVMEPELVYEGPDRCPMFVHEALMIDARLVTNDDFQRFTTATSSPEVDPRSHRGKGSEPCTWVTFEEAEAYASWAGKRLPTSREWEAVVTALGTDRLGWWTREWTATPAKEGHVVRGGRQDDVWDRPPFASSPSHQSMPSDDVGFRCVLDR